MTFLTHRPTLAHDEVTLAVVWWIVLVVVGLVGGGLAALIVGGDNNMSRDARAFTDALRDQRISASGEHAVAIALLRDLAGREGTLRELVTIRYGPNPDPLVRFQEIAGATAKSGHFLTDYPDHVRRALAGEEVSEDQFPRLWSPSRTFLLALGIGWASGSLMFWLILCWWYGIFDGYHPYSGLGWNAVGVYVAIPLTLPGAVVNAALVGIFYVLYGVFIGRSALARTPVEPATPSAPLPEPPLPEPPPAKRDTPVTRLPDDVTEMIREFHAARAQTLTLFESLVVKAHARRGVLVKDAVGTAAASLERAQRAFVCAQAAYEKWRRVVQNVRAAENIRELYNRLWAHPRVRALHIDADEICIHLTTTVIPVNGKRYAVGDFALRIDPSSGRYFSICIRQASKKAVHPFERRGGGICFGGAAGGLQAFVDTLDYAAFVDYALVMMEQPGKDMHYWRTIE